jgi:hypothetical protein
MANHASQRCRHPTRHVRKSNSKLKLPPLADRKISKVLATSINKRYFQKMKRLKVHRFSEHDLLCGYCHAYENQRVKNKNTYKKKVKITPETVTGKFTEK